MKTVGFNQIVCRVLAMLASLVAVEQARAQVGTCSPPAPVDNAIVTCTGGAIGVFGTGFERGDTINVDFSATVAGIFVNDATINNSGAITVDGIAILLDSVAIANNGTIFGDTAIKASSSVNITANSGTIQGVGASGFGIDVTGGTATITNGIGTISGFIAGINAANVTVNANDGLIEATGANGAAINAATVTVNANDGMIQATGADGAAIIATADVTVTNGSGTIRANSPGGRAIHSINGNVTVANGSGTIQANGGTGPGGALVFAIGGNIVNVTANDGLIEGTGLAAIRGVQAVTVHNNSGTIQANGAGAASIFSLGSVNVTANDGLIGTDGLDGIAIKSNGAASVTNGSGAIAANHGAGRAVLAGGDVTVTNGSGTIQANGVGGIGIASTSLFGVATVTNGTGTIRGNAFGIQAKTVTVTANDGTIEAFGTNGRAINATGDANVTNGTGTIQANADGGVAISATSTANVDNSGRIEAMGTGGVAIVALAGTATVHNLTGGTITGGGGGIGAATLDVTNAFGATINGGTNGVSGSGIVRNAGTIAGGTRSISFIGTGPNTLILQTGSVLNGNAAGSTEAGATNNLILQGSGTANNNFANFNALNMGASDSVWVLNGNSDVGTATINGRLEVGDVTHTSARLSGTVTVNSDGLLAGQGTIVGSVNVNGGVVAPGAITGTAIGALHAAGDVTFGGNSTFRVNANAAGQASKFEVGGVATLSGGRVQVLAQSGTYAPSTAYTILTATGGLASTTFNGVTSNLAFLTPSLSYTANNVTLTLVTNGGGGGDPGGGDTGGGTGGGGTTGGGTGDGTGGGTTDGGTASTGFGFAKVALTRNQRAVATALDRGPVSNPLIIAVLNQTVAGARQAFDALSGEVFGSVHNAQGQEAQFARSAMLGRMRQSSYAGIPGDLGALGFGGPQLAYAAGDTSSVDSASAAYATKAAPGARGPSRDLTFWAQGLGGWGHADSDGNAASLRSRFGGFLSGVDARFGDTLRAGFVAGYMRSDLNVDARSSSAGIDSVQLGGYASGRVGAFNVRGGASWSLDSIDTSRAIVFPGFTDKASARFHGNVGQVFGEVGYGMAFGQVAVEPLAGLAYVHVRDGSFLESGGVAALSGSSANENTGYSFVGVRAATLVPLANGTVLVPRGMLQWQHAFGDVTPVTALAFQGTGAGFSVAGIPIARDTALVEAGFDWRFAPQAKLGAFYQGELAAHAQTHAVKGAFTWDF